MLLENGCRDHCQYVSLAPTGLLIQLSMVGCNPTGPLVCCVRTQLPPKRHETYLVSNFALATSGNLLDCQPSHVRPYWPCRRCGDVRDDTPDVLPCQALTLENVESAGQGSSRHIGRHTPKWRQMQPICSGLPRYTRVARV